MNLRKLLKKLPESGLQGDALREAAAGGDFVQMMNLVREGIEHRLYPEDSQKNHWVSIEAFYSDSAVVAHDGKLFSFPYSVRDDNTVLIGEPVEVVKSFEQVNGADVMRPKVTDTSFAEAAGDTTGTIWDVRIIEAGTSGNGVVYSDKLLRESAAMFDGVRVFAKSDAEHLKGEGKDVGKLIGWIDEPRFVEARGGVAAHIAGRLNILASETRLREGLVDAFKRGKSDLVGLSIDALGSARIERRGGRVIRIAESFGKILSVDLIVEPGAGGRLVRLVESFNPQEDHDMKLREQMLRLLEAQRPDLYKEIDPTNISDDELEAKFKEAMKPAATSGHQPAPGVSPEELQETVRMIEARAYARTTIGGSNLPAAAKERLLGQFAGMDRFTAANVDEAVAGEREYLSRFVESGRVDLGGLSIESGGQSPNGQQILDDFFDPSKRRGSFREAYVRITGDHGITGMIQNCDTGRMSEALGVMREAIDSTTFANALGTSITRAMLREYSGMEDFEDYRDLVDIVPVRDFRSQERARTGGYGNLPTVAEGDPYAAMTTPSDEKATYTLSKKGGTESVTLETIANDDVGQIMLIPRKLARAAKRTLYEFVLDLMATNPTIYDSTALFTAGHGNLGSAALDATSFAARRLAMKQRTELSSGKRLGITARHLYVPSDLEETAYDMFVRTTNNDESFVQSRKPRVHVVDYWTDTNNWFLTADKADIPLIELGFFNGNEEPELFIQDNPSVGSMFSNDKLTWKIRHIYSGAWMDFRGADGSIVA